MTKSDPPAAARGWRWARRRRGRSLVATALALCTLGAGGALSTSATAQPVARAPKGRPVMLMCGSGMAVRDLTATQACELSMGPLRSFLQGTGRRATIVEFGDTDDIGVRSAALARTVDATLADPQVRAAGHTKVDVIGHSLGGLAAQWYIKRQGGQTRVRHNISMGTGHKGNDLACLPSRIPQWAIAVIAWIFGMTEPLPDLSKGGELYQHCTESSYLKGLNRGDDTRYGFDDKVDRGEVAWSTMWVPEDTMMPPSPASAVDGGACFNAMKDDIHHSDEPLNPTVHGYLLRVLDWRPELTGTAGCPFLWQEKPIV